MISRLTSAAAIVYGGLLLASGLANGSPVGSWSFNDAGGPTAVDGSGNNLNATIYGNPMWVIGKNGGGLQFDGGTYASISDSPHLDGTNKLSISFWVRPTGLNGNPQFVLSKRSGLQQNQSYGLFFGAGNKLNVDLNYNADSGDRFESRTTFQNGQWCHVHLVFDGESHQSQRMRLYVNGSLDRDGAMKESVIPDHSSQLFLGTGNASYGYFFKGVIDDLSISKEVPSADQLAPAHQALWTLEKWPDMPYKDVGSLVRDPRFYQLPGSKEVLSEAGKNLTWYQAGGRLRGRIEVPSSGRYVFWVSARTGAELYISSDSNPFLKKKVAHMSPISGTGDGIRSNEVNIWDQFESQMSEPIALIAGQKYYIETICQVSVGDLPQVRLAWAQENGERTPIPGTALSYYLIPSEDGDDDSLPDVWEIQHQLNPLDNGASDTEKEGEYGDFDGDGLTNREEYIMGTNPRSIDSDGDGRSDFAEVKTFNSSPLVADPASEVVVGTVQAGNFAGATDNWSASDDGIVSEGFRGEIEWDFTVPQSGVWILQVGTTLLGQKYGSEAVDFGVSIDGLNVGRHRVDYGGDKKGALRIIRRQLQAGVHRLKIDIDNMLGYRKVEINSIEIRQANGPDANANGIPDWLESKLMLTDRPDSHSLYSRISPFCLEGSAMDPSSVKVNGLAVNEGADDTRWFSNLPLEPAAATSYSVDFPSGLATQGEVTWQATNVMDGGELSVRTGDSLKLGAWTSDVNASASISVSSNAPTISTTLSGAVSPDISGSSGSIRIPASGSNFLRVADSDCLDGTDRLTISFLAKPDAGSLTGVPRGIISKRESTNSQVAYSVFVYTGGRLFIDLDVGTSTPMRFDTGYTMAAEWQAVSITFDGTRNASERLKIYVNGVLRKILGVPTGTIRNLTSPLFVGTLNAGYQSGGAPVSFGGLIDDVRIVRNPSNNVESSDLEFAFNDAANLAAQVLSNKASYQIAGTNTVPHQFTGKQQYKVRASHSDGSVAELMVHVRRAEFQGSSTLLENNVRYWSLDATKIDPALVFEPGRNLRMGTREVLSANHYRYRIFPREGGSLGIAARLWKSGPITGIGRVNVVAMSDALQSGASRVTMSTDFPGYYVVKAPLVVKGLPAGGRVVITIFKSGTMFMDGSMTRTLWVDDLENDVAYIEFLYQIGLPGGYCHYIDVYDAAGNHLGRR